MTDNRITIGPIETERLNDVWPVIGPYLVMGAENEGDMWEALADIDQGRARVWAILEDGEPVAAFLTSVIDGNALDVYGLGGKRMLRWGKALTDAMLRVAEVNGCEKIVFKGRKALRRCYPEIREIGQEGPNLYHYERAVA